MIKLGIALIILETVYAQFCESGLCENNEVCCDENTCCPESNHWFWTFILCSMALMIILSFGLWYYFKKRTFPSYKYQLVPEQVKVEEP